MGMERGGRRQERGGGWPCARSHSPIAIFHFGIVMSLWGLIILAPPPPVIKLSPVDGFGCSGFKNDCLDKRIFMMTLKIVLLSI